MNYFFEMLQIALSRSNASRYWKFEQNGQDQSITINFHVQGVRTRVPEKATFFLDENGCGAAVKFIKERL